MSAIALAVGICISCQKEREPSPDPGTSGGQVTVIATISDGGTKVLYSEEGANLNQSWSVGDRIVGWDAAGNAIELEIADEDKITDGTAIFTPVTDSAPIPTSGKVYMIYAPDKHYTDVINKTLEYDLSNQGSGKLPALMTATGSVSDNVLALNFINRLAIVAVRNPTFPVTAATPITGLQLSGGNILTKATFSEDNGELKIDFSEPGTITKACNFTTATDGKTSETMVYFAVLPNSIPADVTVSTSNPTGYQILFENKLFEAGKCYMLDQKNINKQKFAITVQDGITGGTISTSPSGNVAWGETVTVTATPDTGYGLDAITVKDADGVSVTVSADGKFTMPAKNVTVTATFEALTGTINGHNYVKIGGKKWATTNIGATNPQDYGKYFQWGENAGHECNGTTNGSTFKDGYSFKWASAPFNNGQSNYNGTYFTNNKSTWITDDVLKPEYDAAYKSWGSSWRMPTKDDFIALGKACGGDDYGDDYMQFLDPISKNSHIENGKVKKGIYWLEANQTELSAIDELKNITAAGMLYSDGENYLFFPAAGGGNGGDLNNAGTYGDYWSSALYSDSTDYACRLYFGSGNVNPQYSNSRYGGFSVRPLSD